MVKIDPTLPGDYWFSERESHFPVRVQISSELKFYYEDNLHSVSDFNGDSMWYPIYHTNNPTPPVRYRVSLLNPELCSKCGGRCCRVPPDVHFLSKQEAKILGLNIKPKYDRHLLLGKDRRHKIWKSLLSQGIDPEYCPYHDPSAGCIIPRDLRTSTCLNHSCIELWDNPKTIRSKFWKRLYDRNSCWNPIP